MRAYADRIVVRCAGEVVAEHARCFGRGRTVYDPWHYLPVLARKPGALRNGAPFQDWSLPPALTRLRRKLGRGDEADRRFVRVLAAVLIDGLDAVDDAVREALDAGAASDDRDPQHPGPPARAASAGADHHVRGPGPAPPADRRLRPLRPACEVPVQRHEMIAAMGALGLKGMAGAFDEAVTTGLQRNRTAMEILTDLLQAEAAHRHAASIRYRMTAAKLPVIKDLAAFAFEGTPINEGLVRSLHAGAFLANQRNIVLVGGTGTGKTHLAIAITANVVRAGARGRYFNTVDLVNRLEDETRRGKAGALAAQLCRLDLVVLDELGYLPFAQVRRPAAVPPDQQALRAHLGDHHHQPGVRRMAQRLRRPQDDHRAARPAHPPLRHRRDRQRQLAAQTPHLIRPAPELSTGCSTSPRPPPGEAQRSAAHPAATLFAC